MEEEIDLRKYIDVLRRHWKLIVIITVIAVFVAGLVSFLMPPVYEARANVLVSQTRYEIAFVQNHWTYVEKNVVRDRQTLVILGKSSGVAALAIAELKDELEPEEQRLGDILDKVEVRQQGDFIEISVKDNNPEKAAAIANAWANSYGSYVNGIYGVVLQSPEELQIQADAIRKDYEGKQKAYEDFISDNRIDELNRQVTDRELVHRAKLLREQIETGASSPASDAANSMVFILLQASAYTSSPLGSQVSLESLSGMKVSLDDIDALISTLEARSGSTPGQSVAELQQEINQLKAELEQERARKCELENSRDIARDAYTAIAGRVVEAEVAVGAQSAVVRVAATAMVPESSVAPHRVMNIGIALVLGLVVGVFGAFGVEYFRKSGETPEASKEEQEAS